MKSLFKQMQMQLFIKTSTGKTICVDADKFDTIDQIKQKVFNRTKEIEIFEVSQYCLFYSGRKLEDDGSLEEQHVQNESTINICLSLNGGSGGGSSNSKYPPMPSEEDIALDFGAFIIANGETMLASVAWKSYFDSHQEWRHPNRKPKKFCLEHENIFEWINSPEGSNGHERIGLNPHFVVAARRSKNKTARHASASSASATSASSKTSTALTSSTNIMGTLTSSLAKQMTICGQGDLAQGSLSIQTPRVSTVHDSVI